jgi:hypothetical protein
VGFDEGLMITISSPDRREYQQNTLHQTPTVQKWRHLCRNGKLTPPVAENIMKEPMSKGQIKNNK